MIWRVKMVKLNVRRVDERDMLHIFKKLIPERNEVPVRRYQLAEPSTNLNIFSAKFTCASVSPYDFLYDAFYSYWGRDTAWRILHLMSTQYHIGRLVLLSASEIIVFRTYSPNNSRTICVDKLDSIQKSDLCKYRILGFKFSLPFYDKIRKLQTQSLLQKVRQKKFLSFSIALKITNWRKKIKEVKFSKKCRKQIFKMSQKNSSTTQTDLTPVAEINYYSNNKTHMRLGTYIPSTYNNDFVPIIYVT